ncbi:sensor histidine kinase [Brevibacillus daliensis]|uniref:sensor histidine kinase n=1 Tax=Brevibacillus daliensis TaxID=2892995 RepID=UPI001E2E8072|nr:sensor histidine kinase [Brevibacillus daliensis]
MSLRFKIVSVFVCCLLLAFLPLIFIIQLQVKSLNKQEVERQTLQLISAKANEVGSWLNERLSEIRIIHEYPYVKELDFTQIKPYITRINQIVKDNYGNPGESFAIGGLDGQGWINDATTIDVCNRTYFYQAIQTDKEYAISRPVVSKFDNQPIFLICYPIRNELGKKIGFINGAVSLERITQVIEDIDIYDGFVWIMNREGDVYTGSGKGFEERDLSREKLLDLAKQSMGSQAGTLVTAQNKSTLFYSSVPYADDWLLCMMIDNDKIHAETNYITNLIVIVCLLLIVASVGLAIFVSGSITRPIERLKRHMLEVSAGNLDAVYKKSDGEDEISVLGSVFNNMLGDIKKLIRQVYQIQGQKRRAELRVLQSQINPHFLYNTLDTIQWKALSYNAYEVADMIQLLSKLFRTSLNNGKEYITVEEEIAHVSTYLEIQKIRYKEKAYYEINVEPSITNYLMPKLIIQPLVENAIYHGMKPKKQPGKIEIKVWQQSEHLYLSVQDDGVGIPEQRLEQIRDNLKHSVESDHYGLYNINERLTLAYGEQYGITLNSQPGIGTIVQIKIPIASEEFVC